MYTEETGGELLAMPHPKHERGYVGPDIGCIVPDEVTKISQGEQSIKRGKGVVRGVSNYKEQPGKTLTLFDGEITIVSVQLANAFFGETLFDPGMRLDVVFSTELRSVNDEEEIDVIWY